MYENPLNKFFKFSPQDANFSKVNSYMSGPWNLLTQKESNFCTYGNVPFLMKQSKTFIFFSIFLFHMSRLSSVFLLLCVSVSLLTSVVSCVSCFSVVSFMCLKKTDTTERQRESEEPDKKQL